MSDAAKQQHEIIGVSDDKLFDFEYNPSPESEWFKKGKNLGLFIHFGLSSVNGKVDLSWGMMANKPYETMIGYNNYISPNEYFSLAEKFKPVNFEAETDKLLKKAKEMGCTYAVFTTKHHDGFAMWKSSVGDYNIGMYNDGMDLVEIFTRLCRKNGLKVGLYYSPPDWHVSRRNMSFNYTAPPYMGMDLEELAEKPVMTDEVINNLVELVNTQILELITNYGRIDILWFDGVFKYLDRNVISYKEIRKRQPQIIFTPRFYGYGDFKTFECRMPEEQPDGVWEHCDIWAEGPWWGYMEQSKTYKSAQWLIERYENVKKMNGNFLVNIGPKADGSIPDIVYKRMDEVIEVNRRTADE